MSSNQAGLQRRCPRSDRQLALVLIRCRALQVREDLRDDLRLLDDLAIQTRQSARAILANTRSVLLSGDLTVLQQSIDNPSVITARLKKSGHTPEELAQLESWVIALIKTREHHWFQYRDGLLDKEVWQAYRTAIPYVLSYPLERAYWNFVKHNFFDQGFVAEIDDLLKDLPVVTDLRPTIERALEASRARAQAAL